MADPRDVETVADAIRNIAWEDGEREPLNAHDDAARIAEVALAAMETLPRRAKEVRATRNG